MTRIAAVAALLFSLVPCYGERSKTLKTTDVLWTPPSAARIHSLPYGPGGKASAPRPPFRFIKEEEGGTSPKVWVKDALGRTWIAKWGNEVHAEAFAARLVYAMGFYSSPVHFVRQGRILGAKDLDRADKVIQPDGSFREASFKQIDPKLRYISGAWQWNKNPFLFPEHKRVQLVNLKIMMLLLSNWDGKDKRRARLGPNTAVLQRISGRTVFNTFAMDDWGASLGRWGGFLTHEKWDCQEYASQNEDFIKGVTEFGQVRWGFKGHHEEDITSGISTADVSRFLQYLGRISDAQITTALRESGASPAEARCYTVALRDRINQLKKVARFRTARQLTARR